MLGLARWRRRLEARRLERRAVPDALWQLTLARYPFLAWRDPADATELRRLTALFLDAKEFSGAQGFEVSDEVAVAIAAQACVPVLKLGLHWYDGFVGIVVHPDEVSVARELVDDAGVVHQWNEVLAGEAMQGGPMMLSWHDVQASSQAQDWAYNVVIHEFAHVIDLRDGAADGIPPLVGGVAAREAWISVLDAEFEAFCRAVERGRETLLDPYGAEGPDEFFAVASESFFVTPQSLQTAHPALYRLLEGFYRQDPASTAGQRE